MIACYDQEIYYYTNGSAEDLDEDLFEETSKEEFIESLQRVRDKISSDVSLFLPHEPFALVHGDFCGRNMMVHTGHISAVIDWEFAGSYPLSELLGGIGVELVELQDDNLLEHGQWSNPVGPGNRVLQLARREMIPIEDDGESDEDNGGADETAEDMTGDEVWGD